MQKYTNTMQFIDCKPIESGITPPEQYKTKTNTTEEVAKYYPERRAIPYTTEKVRRVHHTHPEAPHSVRKLNRTHKVIRGVNMKDAMPDIFMAMANKDNKRIEQRDQRRAAREAKKIARLTAQQLERIG